MDMNRPLTQLAYLSLGMKAFPCAAQQSLPSPEAPHTPGPTEDNSFLMQEACNQEDGVVQHISYFQKPTSTGDWAYTQTDEWPLRSHKHQLSLTLSGTHSGELQGVGRWMGRHGCELSLPVGEKRRDKTSRGTAIELFAADRKSYPRARIWRGEDPEESAIQHSTLASLGHSLERRGYLDAKSAQ
jgi:hypothetical protein